MVSSKKIENIFIEQIGVLFFDSSVSQVHYIFMVVFLSLKTVAFLSEHQYLTILWHKSLCCQTFLLKTLF